MSYIRRNHAASLTSAPRQIEHPFVCQSSNGTIPVIIVISVNPNLHFRWEKTKSYLISTIVWKMRRWIGCREVDRKVGVCDFYCRTGASQCQSALAWKKMGKWNALRYNARRRRQKESLNYGVYSTVSAIGWSRMRSMLDRFVLSEGACYRRTNLFIRRGHRVLCSGGGLCRSPCARTKLRNSARSRKGL